MTSPACPSEPGSPRADRPLLAIILRMGAMLMVTTMFTLIKYTHQQGVSLPELMFWRQAMSLPLIIGWLAATGGLNLLRTQRIASHAWRATSGTLGLLTNSAAALLLPLSLQTTLSFTTPLFAVLITALVIRARVGPWRWTAVALGFAGVLIIASPFGNPIPPLGLFVALASGLIVATVSFQIRELSSTEAPITCVFWFAFFGALMAALLLPIYAKPHSIEVWLLLVAIGVTGTFGQFLITAALKHGQVASVVIMDYTALIWATLYGWGIWHELPPSRTWLGAPLIIGAGIVITWREHFLAKRISPTSAMDVEALKELEDGT